MRYPLIAKPFLDACNSILAELNGQEFGWLLRAKGQISLLTIRRSTAIVTRVRLVAGLFAVLTALWIAVDVVIFPVEIWRSLVVARIATTIGFAAILIAPWRAASLADVYRALGMLLAVPTAFFFFSYQHMQQFQLHGIQAAFAAGYSFLPFVMVAGLSIFPLTLSESVAFAAPMLLGQVVAASVNWPVHDWPTAIATFWLLLLITAVSALAGSAQLAFMIAMVRSAIRDGMTGCFTRSSGEELIDLQFVLSCRTGAPMALAFIDLDHFKEINDQFGHEAGDQVLKSATHAIRTQLRTGDILTRWGGEEFVLIMPNIRAEQASVALRRIYDFGFARRPDGRAVTVSVGIAERVADAASSWKQLVEIADVRMYRAKQGGRNRIVGCGNYVFPAGNSAEGEAPVIADGASLAGLGEET